MGYQMSLASAHSYMEYVNSSYLIPLFLMYTPGYHFYFVILKWQNSMKKRSTGIFITVDSQVKLISTPLLTLAGGWTRPTFHIFCLVKVTTKQNQWSTQKGARHATSDIGNPMAPQEMKRYLWRRGREESWQSGEKVWKHWWSRWSSTWR